MASAGRLRLEYLAADDLPARLEHVTDSVLGGFCFGHPAQALDVGDMPMLAVDMALASTDGAVCEIWRADDALVSGRHGAIHYRQGATFLFGCVDLDELRDVAPQIERTPLQAATEAAYQAIFKLLAERDFPSILRAWNYFPAINAESHEIERYRQFNVGRQEAFLAHNRPVVSNVPAACALGSAAGGLQIAFMATRAKVIGIENPRQVSAYHYPSQYGPRSPTFARAGLITLDSGDVLFVSGTASIVGHQSLHIGDVAAQTRECLQNIAAVVSEANRVAGKPRFRLDELAFKVYVRHLHDAFEVRRIMMETVGAPVSALFLQADICRSDLLVEIEASGGHAVIPVRAIADTAGCE
ncbi:MAG: hypothetical protein IV085_04510 [Thiobacillus sp.]|nr:hypothetical protein [Thiobacillus sp.]